MSAEAGREPAAARPAVDAATDSRARMLLGIFALLALFIAAVGAAIFHTLAEDLKRRQGDELKWNAFPVWRDQQ